MLIYTEVTVCIPHTASKASLHGLNIQSILKGGGWSRESTFTKYYKKDFLIYQSSRPSLFQDMFTNFKM